MSETPTQTWEKLRIRIAGEDIAQRLARLLRGAAPRPAGLALAAVGSVQLRGPSADLLPARAGPRREGGWHGLARARGGGDAQRGVRGSGGTGCDLPRLAHARGRPARRARPGRGRPAAGLPPRLVLRPPLLRAA